MNELVAMATDLARKLSEAEPLHADLSERLDEPDLDDDLDAQPVDEIFKALCRDLGIAHHLGTHPRAPGPALAPLHLDSGRR